MSRVVLDTDILSEILKRRNVNVGQRAVKYFEEHGRLTITCVTVLEIVSGRRRLRRDDRVREFVERLRDFEVLPFNAEAAVECGLIEGDLVRIGRTIGRADSMIAAIAVVRGLPLVTGNTEHYARIGEVGHPLVVENWRTPGE